MRLAIILAVLLFPLVAFADGEPTINWEELGSVDQQKQFYPDGAIFVHPAGTQYIHQNGNWVLYTPPVTASAVPEPGSFFLLGAGLVAAGWAARRKQ